MPPILGAMLPAVAGGVFGMIQNRWNQDRQYNMQSRLQELQIKGAKDLAKQSNDLQYDMWNKTNYSAQVEHMKKAGLNPALMYGMGGGGGATTGSGSVPMPTGATAEGPSAASKSVLDMAMMMSNKALMDAQTKKTNAEADSIADVQTREKEQGIAQSQQQTSLLAQQEDNERWKQELMKAELTLKQIGNYEQQATQQARMQHIESTAGKAAAEVRTAANEAKVSDATVQEKIKIVQQQAIGEVLRNSLTSANINATNEQISKWAQELAQGWTNVDTNQKRLELEKTVQEIKANFPSMSEATGRIINDGMEAIFRAINGDKKPNQYQIK